MFRILVTIYFKQIESLIDAFRHFVPEVLEGIYNWYRCESILEDSVLRHEQITSLFLGEITALNSREEWHLVGCYALWFL
jgi:hypothetical protein